MAGVVDHTLFFGWKETYQCSRLCQRHAEQSMPGKSSASGLPAASSPRNVLKLYSPECLLQPASMISGPEECVSHMPSHSTHASKMQLASHSEQLQS